MSIDYLKIKVEKRELAIDLIISEIDSKDIKLLENEYIFNMNKNVDFSDFMENVKDYVYMNILSFNIENIRRDTFNSNFFERFYKNFDKVKFLNLLIKEDYFEDEVYEESKSFLDFIKNLERLDSLRIYINNKEKNKTHKKLIHFLSKLKLKQLFINPIIFHKEDLTDIFKNDYFESLGLVPGMDDFEDIIIKYLPYNKKLKHLYLSFCGYINHDYGSIVKSLYKNFSLITINVKIMGGFYSGKTIEEWIKEITERNRKLEKNEFFGFINTINPNIKIKNTNMKLYNNDNDNEMIEKARKAKRDLLKHLLHYSNLIKTIEKENPDAIEKIFNE